MTPLRYLIVSTKNHVDIGFTENEGKVLHDACRWLLPVAAAQAKRQRESGADGLCWVVPAFIAELALEWLEGDELRVIEEGFACGDLAWHALPFTSHTELMDQSLLDASTAVSRRLDARFGLHTTCARLTDVPGHTIALVRALSRAGITNLHIGTNWMSPSPDVPRIGRWRDHEGNEVVLAISPDYGGEFRLPGEDCALFWSVVGDNCEVPSEHDVRAQFAAFRAKYPGAEVRAGRPDDWAGTDLLARAADLPIIDVDLGDSWIHGTGSDPFKTQRYRELLRLRREWLAANRLMPGSRTSIRMDTELMLVAEHTWGGAVAGWTHHDRTHWNNADFARVRNRGAWKALEASWQEQRDHVDKAIEALDDPTLRAEAQAACDRCAPQRFDRTGWDAIDPAASHNVGDVAVRLDARGALISANDGTERLAGPTGLLRYQTFDDSDCRRAVDEYCTWKAEWLCEEFAKLGLAGTDAVSRFFEPRVLALWRRGDALSADLAFEEAAIAKAGAPRRVTVTFTIRAGRIDARLDWFEKFPTRLPEALWWSFAPKVASHRDWRFDKAGTWMDPLAVPAGGGRWLHGVQTGARNGSVVFLTRDAHLLALGHPMIYQFPNTDIDPRGGLHLNLVNNCWGTNFPQWCGDDLAFRAALTWE